MARKKIMLEDITLEDAFSVFQRHGLQVKVEGVREQPSVVLLADFLEESATSTVETPKKISEKKVRITLYAQHTIASAGNIVEDNKNEKHVKGNSIESYGPGVVTVPNELAAQLLHQDGVARQADANMLDGKLHTRIIIPRSGRYSLVEVSQESGFDISSLLGNLGTNHTL